MTFKWLFKICKHKNHQVLVRYCCVTPYSLARIDRNVWGTRQLHVPVVVNWSSSQYDPLEASAYFLETKRVTLEVALVFKRKKTYTCSGMWRCIIGWGRPGDVWNDRGAVKFSDKRFSHTAVSTWYLAIILKFLRLWTSGVFFLLFTDAVVSFYRTL